MHYRSVLSRIALAGVAALLHAGNADHVPGQLLVKARRGANSSAVSAALRANGAKAGKSIPALGVTVLRVPENAEDQVAGALKNTGLFTFVERDGIAKTHSTPNDPDFPSQWHLYKIQGPSAWNYTVGQSGVVIGVIDSGLDTTHPDLAPKLTAGWNFITGTSTITDTMGHGTAVSGTAAAATNNGAGVSGVAWNNLIMPLVVVDSTGNASYSNMASAITYAADNGARVVNLSLAGSTSSSTLQSAVDYAWNKGVVVVAAAGNYSTSAPYYPAACNNVMAVSSTDANDNFSTFSDYGSWISVSAPGENILTTNSGGSYGGWSGTSFSSPIVAGLAALVFSYNPALTPATVVSLIEKNADDLGTPGFDNYYGWGRVNAYRTLLAASTPTAIDTIPPTVSISAPGNGVNVTGTISIQGTATDNVGVTSVSLYIDGQLASSSSASSFSFSWNTLNVLNGSHTLKVQAADAAGNLGSSSITVNVGNAIPVADTIPPTVQITSPANGATVSRTVNINVAAQDNVAVAQVTIYVDNVAMYTGSVAPYTYSWSTRKLASGAHTITATAWDAAGNRASTSITAYK